MTDIDSDLRAHASPARSEPSQPPADGPMPVAEAAASGLRFAMGKGLSHARDKAVVPISATELMNVAQDLPLLFRQTGPRWDVVGVLAPAALKRPMIDGRGSWRGEYTPVVLRLHPFVADGSRGALAIDRRGLRQGAGEGHAFADAAGRPTERLKRIAATAEAAREGIRRLGERVAALDAAGLIAPAPLMLRFERPCSTVAPLFAIDGQRLASLSPASLAALADGAPSSLDLAIAAMYSSRRFAAEVVVENRASLDDEIAARIDAGLRAAPVPSPVSPRAAATGQPMGDYFVDASANLDFSSLPF
ncbi:SapC family protein [uncultured Alsobacter sp.]|uniref:SapC family protein n=1 Tax=uncultured Alsobacter sp. TaxID=1748258 RepID=UPI0025F5B1EA|nr:SapC family protein [uncultured Alsobacter sp.]